MTHYSMDIAVVSRKRGDDKKMCGVYIPDISRKNKKVPSISAAGPNSNVLVMDFLTLRPLRLESPKGFILEEYYRRSPAEVSQAVMAVRGMG